MGCSTLRCLSTSKFRLVRTSWTSRALEGLLSDNGAFFSVVPVSKSLGGPENGRPFLVLVPRREGGESREAMSKPSNGISFASREDGRRDVFAICGDHHIQSASNTDWRQYFPPPPSPLPRSPRDKSLGQLPAHTSLRSPNKLQE